MTKTLGPVWKGTVVAWIFSLLGTATSLPATDLSFRFFRVGISSSHDTEAVSLSTDKFGNTYVVGNTYGSFGEAEKPGLANMCIFAAKFSRSGILIWLIRTGSARKDRVYSVLYHDSVLYVTGTTQGQISLSATGQTKSRGLWDGFVLAFNSFTGKRKWEWQIGGPQVSTEVNVVTVLGNGQLIVAGHANGEIFSSNPARFSDDRAFVARLRQHKGVLQASMQYRPSDLKERAFSRVIPVQILWSTSNARIHVLLSMQGRDTVVTSLFATIGLNLELLSVRRLHSIEGSDVLPGFGQDVLRRRMVFAFSLKNSSRGTRDLGIQTRALDDKADMTSEDKVDAIDMDSGSDDTCRGLVVNRFGMAFVLSLISFGGSRMKEMGIWVYDTPQGRTVGKHLTTDELAGGEFQIAGVQLDDSGNIVIAGVSIKPTGMKEVLLGTFGIPQGLKTQGAYGVHAKPDGSNGGDPGSPLRTPKPSFVESESTNVGFFEKGPTGMLSVPAILVICFIVFALLMFILVVFWCLYWRR